MGGWNAKKWIGEDSGDEPCRRGSDRYKRKPPNDLRSIKKKLMAQSLLLDAPQPGLFRIGADGHTYSLTETSEGASSRK